MEFFANIDNIITLITLTWLEIILGIDNVIFIAILVNKLDHNLRNKSRMIGLTLALVLRILLLFSAAWMINLTEPFITIWHFPFSGRNILLLLGGLFLVVKPIKEIITMFQGEDNNNDSVKLAGNFASIIGQIIFIDLILSFDSIITAVGIAPNNLPVIIVAIIIAMVIMLIASRPIGDFIHDHPSIKVIALNFILLVGVFLVEDGLNIHLNKNYLYCAVAFATLTETINVLLAKKNKEF